MKRDGIVREQWMVICLWILLIASRYQFSEPWNWSNHSEVVLTKYSFCSVRKDCGKTAGTVRGLSFKAVTLRRCCGNSAERLRKHCGHNAEHGQSRCGRDVGVHHRLPFPAPARKIHVKSGNEPVVRLVPAVVDCINDQIVGEACERGTRPSLQSDWTTIHFCGMHRRWAGPLHVT